MPAITVLDKSIYELIAAGEVIEKPASVIKEVVENSIDAGSKHISVEIKKGGIEFMRVADDGCGIAREDVPTAFLRHATSKINEKDDLDRIQTLGFRGEALASVAAVSKVTLLTKRPGDEFGTSYKINGSVEEGIESIGCPDGTTIIIRELFYNVPARRKFLKKEVTEGNAISFIIRKVALSHPEISFKFIRDNRMEFCSPGNGDLKAAIYAVYGKDFANDMLPVDYTAGDIRVRGYTIKPLYSKNNRSFQNFFVGSRYVFSKICSKALESAYETLIMVGKFPACVLDIIMPPDSLDVNIHPAKAEVRFTDEKAVSDAVFFAVKNALMQADLIYDFQMPKAQPFNNWKERAVGKNTDFVQPKLESGRAAVTASAEDENDVIITVAKKAERDSFQQSYENISSAAVTVRETVREAENIFSEPETIKEISSIRPQSLEKPAKPDGLENKEEVRKTKQGAEERAGRLTESPAPAETLSPPLQEEAAAEDTGKTAERAEDRAEEKRINVIGEAFKNYIIAEADENVIFIDKHAAHERVLYEKLRRGIGRLEQQYLLTPSKLLLSAAETDALQTNQERLLDLGFIFDFSETPFVLMKAVPMFLDCLDADEIVSEIAENLMSCKQDPQTHYFEDMLHTMACKAAIKENFNNLTAELQYLADEIYDDINIRHCPHGRPILFKISKNELDKQFGRLG